MGETGPCGPSSEIFFDHGPEHGPDGGPANPEAERRYVEIWNLSSPSTSATRTARSPTCRAATSTPAPAWSASLAVLSGSASLYAADVLAVLVERAPAGHGHRLGDSELGDIALRLLADHTRTSAFLVADGVVPSNEDRGYVLRRVIRRAVRFAYMLGVEQLVLPPMVERCIEIMGDAYPELVEQRALVLELITREEERFRQTLARGSSLLDSELDSLGDGGVLDGRVAFELHDTFGFRSR